VISSHIITELCRRWFDAGVVEARTLTIGTVNETLRVELTNGETVILRVGPADDEGIKNGVAALALVESFGELVPKTLGVDNWTDRLVTAQSLVRGLLASGRVPGFDVDRARAYFHDLGRVARRIHDVRGTAFGSVLSPGFSNWSDAVKGRLEERIREYDAAGIDADPLRVLLEAVPAVRARLDVAEPRLLHGDLWSLNILLDEHDRISGVVDWDNASWGDPVADWTIYRIRQRAGTAADAFWETYGPLPTDLAVRSAYAAALNTSGSRLDIERRGLSIAEIPAEHWDLAPVLDEFSRL
jgi:aminoglycoside phosphotransferase (APT) family kinase protein